MHKNKNLLVVNQYASTPEYSSGAGERFYYLAPYFNEKGFNVTIISGAFNHLFLKLPKAIRLFNDENIPGGKFVWVRLRNYKAESFFGRFFSWFEFLIKLFFYPIDNKQKPDYVLVSSMSLFPVVYAIYLKYRFKCKFILEVRDIWPLTPVELGGYSEKHPFIFFMKIIEKNAYKKADSLVSVLPGFGRHVHNIIGYSKEVSWIPNGIQQEININNIQPINNSKKFIVTYTGAIGIANALEYLIEAAKLLSNIDDIIINIVGDGPEKDKLKNKVYSQKIKNVQFVEKVPKSEIHKILDNSDVCIILWRDKNIYKFGVSANKYNDYMLSGKPIISASRIEDDPVKVSGCGKQVVPENPHEIAKAIIELKSLSSKERIDLGQKGYNYVINYQTYLTLSDKYLQTLKNIK